MFKIKAEPLGKIRTTAKGFIRQYLYVDGSGQKRVIDCFSKDQTKLEAAEIQISNNFFFIE